MKVKIDQNKCIGCGLCSNIAPKVFKIKTKKNKAEVANQPKEIDDKVKRAADSCPVQAISIKKEAQ